MEYLTELSLVHDQVYDNEIVNVIDQEYDYKDDLDDLSTDDDIDIVESSNIRTRSKAKKEKQLKRQEREDDDEIDDDEYFSKLNYQFNNIKNYMQSHEDFMKQIFGHRDDAKVLDFSKYRQFQESDHLLKIVIRNFKIADKNHDKWIESDIDHLVIELGFIYHLCKMIL